MIMKTFILVLVLIINLQSWTKADDISDFEIDGMSIGDSVLKFYSKEKIKNEEKINYPSSDSFYGISFYINNSYYDAFGFIFKKNDNDFIIYQVKGMLKMDFKECIKKKDSVKKEIKNILENFKENNYTSVYGKKMGKSFSEVSDLDLENGRIRVWCENWDRNFEESKYWNNHFSVSAASKEYLDWLDNEAY